MPTDARRTLSELLAKHGPHRTACAMAEVLVEQLRHRANEARVALLVEQAIEEGDDA